MPVEPRIDAAMNDHNLSPDVDGDQTAEVDIPSSDLDLDEVLGHDLVEDAFEKDDQTFTIYVNASAPERHFGSV